MNASQPLSIPLPLRMSGSALKVLAVLSMIIDHWAYFFVDHDSVSYEVMRSIGRIAFPVFAFLIAEGFTHSHHRMKYFLTLLGFAVISEIPWFLLNGNDGTHNVMFTLALGVAAISAFDRLREHSVLLIGSIVLFSFLAWKFGTDYDWRGVSMIVIFYMLQRQTIEPWIERYQVNFPSQAILQMVFTFPLMIHYGVIGALLASCAIFLYDGTRGFITGKAAKYAFYAIYPTHLLLIVALLLVIK